MIHDVIVCVHNGLDDVRQCVESLINHWSGDLNKLIIVDDKSENETRSALLEYSNRHEYFSVIRLEHQHYYTKASNHGLSESKAEIRTLLNSDTIVTAGWDRRIRKVFQSYPAVGIVGSLSNAASTQSLPFVKSSSDQTAINTLPPGVDVDTFSAFVSRAGEGREPPFVPLVHGFCLSLRRAVIESIGYFDEESFPRGYGEENDYCFRADDAGFLLAIALDSFIFHAKSKSYTSSDRAAFMRAGMENFVRKHGEDRVKQAVRFMEANPHLQYMRDRVFSEWPQHYSANG